MITKVALVLKTCRKLANGNRIYNCIFGDVVIHFDKWGFRNNCYEDVPCNLRFYALHALNHAREKEDW